MINTSPDIYEEISRLMDLYRPQCLWFLKTDVTPNDPDSAARILDYIERYGDRSAYEKVQKLKKCLLQNSSAISAS